jgi:hypothetical protein
LILFVFLVLFAYTDYKKFESCVAAIHGTMYIGIYGYVGGSYKLLGGRKSNCVNP